MKVDKQLNIRIIVITISVILSSSSLFASKDIEDIPCLHAMQKVFDGTFMAPAIEMKHMLFYSKENTVCFGNADFHPGGIIFEAGFSSEIKNIYKVGYEVALPWYLLYSVTVESNFNNYHIVAPSIEFATPQIMLIPMFSIGLGMPVMKYMDEFSVGIRLQTGLQLFFIGFFYNLNYYPFIKTDDNGTNLFHYFGGRISF